MRALRCDGKSLLLDTKAPSPAPGPGEALVRVRKIGVSPTDLAIARGRFRPAGGPSDSPITIGHEFVGVVEQVNIPDDAPRAMRDKRELRSRRVVGSASVVCGHCDMCRAGLSPHCRHRTVIGIPGGRGGCMADLAVLPVANLHAVPDSIDDDTALFAYPLACAIHAGQLARAGAKSFIGVLAGDGADQAAGGGGGAYALHALLVAHALSRLDPSTRLLTSSPIALNVCEKWGLKHRPTPEAGRRQDQDAIVECSATSAGLRLAMQFVRPRGVIVIASPVLVPPFPPMAPFPETPAPEWSRPLDLTPLLAGEVSIIPCRDAPPGASEALHTLQRGDLDVRPLITKRFKLDDALAALRAAAEPEHLKVVIEP